MQIKTNENYDTEIRFSWREILTLFFKKKLIFNVKMLDAFTIALIRVRAEITNMQKKNNIK
jgi:hypothetical protein